MHSRFAPLSIIPAGSAMCLAAFLAACQSAPTGDTASQIASAQGGLSAPPALEVTQPPLDEDIIIDDNAPRLPLTGAYAAADPQDIGANAAEKIAIEEIYRREPQRALVENVERELQIVAGVNYRFMVRMSSGERYQIIVYRPLEGDMQVTSYRKLG